MDSQVIDEGNQLFNGLFKKQVRSPFKSGKIKDGHSTEHFMVIGWSLSCGRIPSLNFGNRLANQYWKGMKYPTKASGNKIMRSRGKIFLIIFISLVKMLMYNNGVLMVMKPRVTAFMNRPTLAMSGATGSRPVFRMSMMPRSSVHHMGACTTAAMGESNNVNMRSVLEVELRTISKFKFT